MRFFVTRIPKILSRLFMHSAQLILHNCTFSVPVVYCNISKTRCAEMYKVCKTEESAMRQQMLEEHLLRAMLAKPYEKITISSLCQEAGVPRKAFYRYFSTMNDALLALVDHTLAGSNTMTLKGWDGSDRVTREALEYFFTYWLGQKPFLDALTANNFWPLLIERSTAFINRQKTGTDESPAAADFDKDLPDYFVACGLMTTVLRWYTAGYPGSAKKVAGAVAKLLTEPEISLSMLLR